MKPSTSILNSSVHEVVTFDLVVDKTTVAGDQVLSITVWKEVNRVPSATIVLRDGEAAESDFVISNSDQFTPGKEILIKCGRDGSNSTVFHGLIVKQRVRIVEPGNTELIVDCRDLAVRMTLGRQNRYFEESRDSEVIEEIVGRYGGLTAEVEPTQPVHRELVQHHCTDWDFVLSRAEMNGLLVSVDDGTLKVKKPDTNAAPVLEEVYGRSLLEFDAEMDARYQWKVVEARSWDYANQSMFERTSEAASVKEAGNLSGSTLAAAVDLKAFELRHGGRVLEAELQQWADAAMQKSRLSKICGRAKLFGTSEVKPGQMIRLEGVGERFAGNAYVSGVRQALSQGTWYTDVQLGLSPKWFHESERIIDPAAAGLVPGIRGLQVGKVVQLQDDPNGEDRILVRLPIIDNQARGVWARAALLDAGRNRGTFFRPEIDDEVIVGFINDDPCDAVVLGMLHSSANPAPIVALDSNHEKGVITRSDLRIHFHDDTRTLTISTPAGNRVVLDEDSQSITVEDENQNRAVLDPAGITVESPKDISVRAGGKVDITATGELTMSAASMKLTAQGSMEVTGASSKYAASGVTEVKGSLVKIN